MYFANSIFLIIYVVFVTGIKGKATNLLSVAMSYLGLLISFECFLKVYEIKDTLNNFFDASKNNN